jgi:hypothetical protein
MLTLLCITHHQSPGSANLVQTVMKQHIREKRGAREQHPGQRYGDAGLDKYPAA